MPGGGWGSRWDGRRRPETRGDVEAPSDSSYSRRSLSGFLLEGNMWRLWKNPVCVDYIKTEELTNICTVSTNISYCGGFWPWMDFVPLSTRLAVLLCYLFVHYLLSWTVKRTKLDFWFISLFWTIFTGLRLSRIKPRLDFSFFGMDWIFG